MDNPYGWVLAMVIVTDNSLISLLTDDILRRVQVCILLTRGT